MRRKRNSKSGCAGFQKLSRREAIRVGTLGGLGLSMGDLFRLQAAESGAFNKASGVKKRGKSPQCDSASFARRFSPARVT